MTGIFMADGMQDIPFPESMPDRVMTYRWFAKVYGFTPDQVDEIPAECIAWWPVIEKAEAKAIERKQRQQERSQRR